MRLIDWLVGLFIRFQEWREPVPLTAEELRRRRIEEQERARTEWLLSHRRSEVE
jgi:hypothetical protein